MRLSEAIRKGIEMSLPFEGELTMRGDDGKLYACALGAAHIGNGGDPDMLDRDIYLLIDQTWPVLKTVRTFDPDLNRDIDLQEEIWVKNDRLSWTREQIASWLEREGY